MNHNRVKKLLAFQGEHGAYSETACRQLVGNESVFLPCTHFSEVFNGVADGRYDLGVVPVENSLEGVISIVNNLLSSTDLKVIGETVVSVNHCLLAPEGRALSEIREVFSHPQALGQCALFLEKSNLISRQFYDTAGAAKMISELGERAGAIAGRDCAAMYGLEILSEHIEDDSSNSTRFLLLAKNNRGIEGSKCSVVFSTENEPGSLFRVFKIFDSLRINLSRVVSVPDRKIPGSYRFFLDFEGNIKSAPVKEAICRMQMDAQRINFLGCYPEWESKL